MYIYIILNELLPILFLYSINVLCFFYFFWKLKLNEYSNELGHPLIIFFLKNFFIQISITKLNNIYGMNFKFAFEILNLNTSK